MAFISAVLMLFLSVVLMLPISTLTSKNYFTDSKRIVNNSVSGLMLITNIDVYNFTIFSLFLLVITIILSSFLYVAVTSFKNINNRDIKNM